MMNYIGVQLSATSRKHLTQRRKGAKKSTRGEEAFNRFAVFLAPLRLCVRFPLAHTQLQGAIKAKGLQFVIHHSSFIIGFYG
ncbi:MAG TPA: hypothetical protein VJ715_14120 [Pyrinomonadaceae bacterium]|nr:hypothetical protein [Pyrinomonadaceae bacterium]